MEQVEGIKTEVSYDNIHVSDDEREEDEITDDEIGDDDRGGIETGDDGVHEIKLEVTDPFNMINEAGEGGFVLSVELISEKTLRHTCKSGLQEKKQPKKPLNIPL